MSVCKIRCRRVNEERERSESFDDLDLLPVLEFEDQIVQTVKEHQVVIITGETGSGKSTQIPQILLRNGFS